MEGWIDLDYPAMHRTGVKLPVSRSQIRLVGSVAKQPGSSCSIYWWLAHSMSYFDIGDMVWNGSTRCLGDSIVHLCRGDSFPISLEIALRHSILSYEWIKTRLDKIWYVDVHYVSRLWTDCVLSRSPTCSYAITSNESHYASWKRTLPSWR